MKQGDFTELAKYYGNRPGYSLVLLECLRNHVFNTVGEGLVADIGAGTGKLTENLVTLGLKGYAVEPNAAMRSVGINSFEGNNDFIWSEGYAETTNLEDDCAHWALMGSSFHWTKSDEAIREFSKALNTYAYIEEGNNSYIPNYHMGCIYEVAGDIEIAKKLYQRCGNYKPALARLAEIGK